MIPWTDIQTLLLDMDGTLLDLHFDNHFWREHVPLRYAEKHGLAVEQAKDALYPKFHAMEGRMEWYCVDYWSDTLDMDIAQLKREVDHLIEVHPHVIDFLDRSRERGKRIIMVTNAHQKALDLKMEKTRLGGHFDKLICSHDFGNPKEDTRFWDWLKEQEPYDTKHSLLIDDSLPVLKSARQYGIKHLLAVRNPDTKGPRKDTEDFEAIDSFDDLLKTL